VDIAIKWYKKHSSNIHLKALFRIFPVHSWTPETLNFAFNCYRTNDLLYFSFHSVILKPPTRIFQSTGKVKRQRKGIYSLQWPDERTQETYDTSPEKILTVWSPSCGSENSPYCVTVCCLKISPSRTVAPSISTPKNWKGPIYHTHDEATTHIPFSHDRLSHKPRPHSTMHAKLF
jgi:hypothetical protein